MDGIPDHLRIGIAGLGTASTLVLPYLDSVAGVMLSAAADVREAARQNFEREYRLPTFDSVEALCDSDAVDAVWIATPNDLHCEHIVAAAARGKHIICAKPLAAGLDECDRMIEACRIAGVRLLVGHSKLFDSPVQAMAKLVRDGRLGRVLKIDSWWFNDWLRRPRLAAELDEARGAGFILRQAPHLVDIACYIAASPAVSVRAFSAVQNAGICTSIIQFASGVVASFTLNGCGYFESRELTWNTGVFGGESVPEKPLPRRQPLNSDVKFNDPAAQQARRSRAGVGKTPFVGLTIVSCELGAMRQSREGLYLYTDDGRTEQPVPPNPGRAAELIELRDALREKRDVFPNGEWGRMNLGICLAILRSARENRDICLTSHQ